MPVIQSWPKGSQSADKKKFEQTLKCIICSISRPVFSQYHNVTYQAIAMDRYQSCFREVDNFFPGKQQGEVRTNQNFYSLLIYDS